MLVRVRVRVGRVRVGRVMVMGYGYGTMKGIRSFTLNLIHLLILMVFNNTNTN